MSSPAEIIRTVLILKGVSNIGSFPCFVAYMPDEPDNLMVVYDTTGELDGRIMVTGEVVEHPGIQIMVRAKDYPTGYDKCLQICKAFEEVKNLPVAISSMETYVVSSITRRSGIISLGIDENDRKRRHYFSINFIMTIGG
jgi:hypothetical protein